MLEITREEFEEAALVLLVDDAGNYQWSSNRSQTEVVKMLHDVADRIGEPDEGETDRGLWHDYLTAQHHG